MKLSDPLFIGRSLEDLYDLIEAQSVEVFAGHGLIIPTKSCSLLLTITSMGPSSVAEIARALDRSHQLVQQKLPKLIKLGLIKKMPCPDDHRRNLISVTAKGQAQLAKLEDLQPKLERAYDLLDEESGQLMLAVRDAVDALTARSLSERVS